MGMTCMKVSCLDQRLVVTTAPRIASGGRNENEIAFSFCPLWDGFEKVAVFYRDKDHVYNSVIDADKKCIIPWEVLTDEGEFFFSVFGVNGDITRTSEILKYKVVKGAIAEDTEPSDPTPDMYEQFLEQARANEALVRDAVEVVNEVRDNLDEAHEAATTAQEAALNAEKAAEDAVENTVKKTGDTMTGSLHMGNGSGIVGDKIYESNFNIYDETDGDQTVRGGMVLTPNNKMAFKVKETDSSLYDYFGLPTPGAKQNSADAWYDILTSKRPVKLTEGGTGETTAKGAQYAILNDMNNFDDAVHDGHQAVFRTTAPSATNGVLLHTKMSNVWNYIAGKIRSLFGFSSSNVLSVKNGGTGAQDAVTARANLEAAAAQHDHNRLTTGGSSGDVTAAPEAYDAGWIGWGWSGKYSDDDDTRIAISMRLNKETGRLQTRIDSKAGTRYPHIYTSDDKPTPGEINAVNKDGDEMTGPLTVGNDIAVKGDGWRGMAFRSADDKGRNTIMTGDNNQFVFDTYETGSRFADRYFLPKCTTGKTGDSWYEILTAKNPAAAKATVGITDPVLSSANASDVMRTVHFNVGGALIQTGITDLISCDNNVVTSHTVTFPKAFSAACVVLVSLYNNNDSSSHASAVNAFAATYSKTGCEIRFTNVSGGARTLRASWIAIGM